MSKYQKKLEKLGLVVRKGKGDHRVVMDEKGKKILGVFGRHTAKTGRHSRAHQNLRNQIRRGTGIDIDA